MATKPKSKQNNKTKKESPAQQAESRSRKSPKYKHFRLQKRIKHPKGVPLSTINLFRRTGILLKSTWKPVIGLTLIFAVLQMAIVYGFQAPLNVSEFKDTLNELFEGQTDSLTTGAATLGALFGSQNEITSENGALYSAILMLFFSMSFVWVYRQKTAGNKFTIREAIYRSPYPVTVVLLILLVISLQALPFGIGSLLFSTVMQGGIAVGGYEKAVWWLLLGLTGLLSFYMISSSVFALYISTLPNMAPMKALRSARNLVRYRRFSVMRRILSAALLVVLVMAGILLPVIFFAAPIAGWLYFIFTLAALPLVHAFLYTLYRELL